MHIMSDKIAYNVIMVLFDEEIEELLRRIQGLIIN